eukprot:1299846-Rhodomonas_salina.1
MASVDFQLQRLRMYWRAGFQKNRDSIQHRTPYQQPLCHFSTEHRRQKSSIGSQQVYGLRGPRSAVASSTPRCRSL